MTPALPVCALPKPLSGSEGANYRVPEHTLWALFPDEATGAAGKCFTPGQSSPAEDAARAPRASLKPDAATRKLSPGPPRQDTGTAALGGAIGGTLDSD